MKKAILSIFAIILVVMLFATYKGTVYVTASKCVGCGDCELVCPTDAIKIIDGKAIIDADKCINCEICIKTCTYDAIKRTGKGK